MNKCSIVVNLVSGILSVVAIGIAVNAVNVAQKAETHLSAHKEKQKGVNESAFDAMKYAMEMSVETSARVSVLEGKQIIREADAKR